MKTLPDKNELRIMWSVATSSAIESRQPAYEIFANLLYNDLNDKEFPIKLGEKSDGDV
jgi:hypothetical protein